MSNPKTKKNKTASKTPARKAPPPYIAPEVSDEEEVVTETPEVTQLPETPVLETPAEAPTAEASVPVDDGKITVTVNGKEIRVTPVQPGVVQKTESIFYIQDCVTKEWLYCFPERLARLNAKQVDLANYKGRDTKKAEKVQDAKNKIITRAAKLAEQAAEAQRKADAIQNPTPIDPVIETPAEAPVIETPAEAPVTEPASEETAA